MSKLTNQEWDIFLQSQPGSHILQTNEWGLLKGEFGWSVENFRSGQLGAKVLYRKLPFGKSIGYIPKGPVGGVSDELWEEVDQASQKKQAIFLKFEPDLWEPLSLHLPVQKKIAIIPSNPIQPRRTILVKLDGTEEDWMQRMKQKTRYNIRLAQKKGISVNQSSDLKAFHELMVITGQRDKFGVHTKEYYQKAFDLFGKNGKCALLEARYGNELVGGLMVFFHNQRAWYFYGASSDQERNRMPTYLLQWEAMRWAASMKCNEYDLWGIPDFEESVLEEGFNTRSEDLWGVYRFKRGFGGQIVRSAGAFDRIYQPVYYRLYSLYLRYFRKGGEA